MQLKTFSSSTMAGSYCGRNVRSMTLLSLVLMLLLLRNCCHASTEDSQLIMHAQKRHHNNNLNIKYMLSHHGEPERAEAHVKKFKGDALAYVTPWNNRGYDVVKEFRGKFDYVSPVWYYMERRASMHFDIIGEHDVDHSWMEEVKDITTGKGKILPRFQCRGWTGEDLQAFISGREESMALASLIYQQVNKHGFDGVVVECGFPAFFQLFLSQLSQLLHNDSRELIVVMPAIMTEDHKKYMQPDLFHTMAQYVDRFSLMTYDFSSHDPNGGPSAPIEWMMDNIEYITSLFSEENRHKLLVGVNMYAMSYLQTRGPEALVLGTIVDRLSKRQTHIDDNSAQQQYHHHHILDDDEEFNWDKESQEAWFIDMDEEGNRRGTIWLPTLRSIKNRVRLAEDYGVGIALWEVGQGLDYFYDLF